jgi:hypothetical protein
VLPEGELTIPEGVFTLPLGVVTIPEGVFTLPLGVVMISEGVLMLPLGVGMVPGCVGVRLSWIALHSGFSGGQPIPLSCAPALNGNKHISASAAV